MSPPVLFGLGLPAPSTTLCCFGLRRGPYLTNIEGSLLTCCKRAWEFISTTQTFCLRSRSAFEAQRLKKRWPYDGNELGEEDGGWIKSIAMDLADPQKGKKVEWGIGSHHMQWNKKKKRYQARVICWPKLWSRSSALEGHRVAGAYWERHMLLRETYEEWTFVSEDWSLWIIWMMSIS